MNQPASDRSPSSAAEPQAARRRFLKQSGLLAGGLLAAGAVKPQAVHAAGNGKIRVGLIGCGGRGTGAAVNAMNAGPDVQIVALADLFEDSLTRCAEALRRRNTEQFAVDDDHMFVGFDSYRELIDSGVDVVLLCSPPHYRPDHLEAAVAAGKHIFCEKPIATDPVGVRRVLAASEEAERKGLNLVSGLCWRYDPGVRATMDQIQSGAIGELVTVEENYLTNPVWIRTRTPEQSDMEYQCRNWYYFPWLSGDHYVEQFIHSLDKAMWLHGDTPPVECWGQGGRQLRSDEQGSIYDHFSVVYQWADGTRAFAHTRQMRGCFNQTEDFVFGTKGQARVIAHEIEGETNWKFTERKASMYDIEHQELFSAIRGERDTINNGLYMSNSTLMAIMGREACYSGKKITWEEALNSPQDLRPTKYAWGPAPEVLVRQPGQYKFPTA